MKRLLLFIILSLSFCFPALAQETNSIKFTWDQTIPTEFVGWELYQHTATMSEGKACITEGTMICDIEYTGQTEYTTEYQLVGQIGDTFYFRILAKNKFGKSDCSNEVSYTLIDTAPPTTPIDLIIEVVIQP
ncbi:hypothetical protein ES703_38388 [subsurface metagenome]